MRSKVKIEGAALALLLAASTLTPVFARAQQTKGALTEARPEASKPQQDAQTRPREATPPMAAPAPTPVERLEPDDETRPRADVSAEAQANRIGQRSEEEAAVVPYYNNFLSQYRLGPEDVISITVFGHDRYSKPNITIPPDGILSYYLIREGIQVSGKTTQQVADELAKHLDEYIIDPKVTVSLEKAQSVRYAVLGEVGQPGVRLMTRRLTVYEALLEAGGVLGTGNKKKVVLARYGADRKLAPRLIDIAAIERGRVPDDIFLAPGDQIFVPGNRMKTINKVLELLPVISFARIFTGGW